MGQITVTLNGRSYRLQCRDGEESRVAEVGRYVAERVDSLAAEFGTGSHDRLLAMAALMLADEVFDLLGEGPRQATEEPPAARKAPVTVRPDSSPAERAAKDSGRDGPKKAVG